ncbi:protein STRUBBELIG-RECEPTOR FAMILY 7 [Physcomitrium patens]|uniref:Protein kinase domain-containing protein n=1 Tax=Physcomitrium patens TaxID=3218 RepID=A0A2K1KV61_PHYPA|nr:protein STRUBBELIG-RECEPTOR FAMILY 8-like [Physcomitrium patens]PNR57669.1 hypothetical protein PHYPA_004663 [Physcomitrium patens]|eukprot:XP_024370400.1 protein STRUBBELIG-RECEPTOR FAMILY 8-like [Physcomitrella patens]
MGVDMKAPAKQSLGVGLLLCSVVILSVVSSVYGQVQTDPVDTTGLISMWYDLKQSQSLTGWTQNASNPCGQQWYGVVCDGSSVTEIKIGSRGLNGNFNPSYFQNAFKKLRIFDASNNNIEGNIPQQFPTSLTQMILNNNKLTGGLPQFDQLGALTVVNLSNNNLTGNMNPNYFNVIVNVETFDVSYNQLEGTLPDSILNLAKLRFLNLQNNKFNGKLPDDFSRLKNLQTFNIENNQFTGNYPSGLPSNSRVGGNRLTFPPPPAPGTPAPRTPSPSGTSNGSSSHLPLGAIIGIAAGGAVLLLLLALGICLCCRKRSKKALGDPEATTSSRRPWFTPPLSAKSQSDPSKSIDKTTKRNIFGSSKSEKKSSKHRVFEPAPLDKGAADEPVVKASPPVKVLKAPPSFKGISGLGAGHSKATIGKVNKSNIAATPFSVADLQAATNSFSQDNLIGEGSMGRVYRAEFPNGQVLAVKKIDSSASMVQNEDDFLSVVDSLARLQHANTAELVGYCIEHDQRLLVYEYVSRGTLNELLHFSGENTKALSWNVRIKIALGSARALEYLHEVCAPPVVHRNFKSANILLDDELNPHVSDCGLAALAPSGSERQVSAQMLGSFGYSAPEYAMSGTYTVKSDVYSFGVVMLELLTGRKPLDSSRPRSEQSLVRWATPQLHDIDALARMVDPSLKGIYPAKSLSRFADIVALCVQPEPEFRPPMSEVVQALVRLMQRASLSKRRSESAVGIESNEPSETSL